MTYTLNKTTRIPQQRAQIYNTHTAQPSEDDILCNLYIGCTAPLMEEDKLINEPIFSCGCGLDTESTTIFKERQIKRQRRGSDEVTYDTERYVSDCFCYCYQICIGYDVYLFRTTEEILKCLQTIDKAVRTYREAEGVHAVLYIWVANLSHEWSFLRYRIDNTFKMQRCFAKSNRDVLLIDYDTIQFRECIGLFGHSLAHIADDWAQTKKLTGDLDYDLIRHAQTPLTRKERAYCYNDVIILAEMHRAVLRAYTQDNGSIKLPYTTSGFCRMRLKENIRDSEELTDEREHYNFYHIKHPCKSNFEFLCRQNSKLFVSELQWSICRTFSFCGGLSGSLITKTGKILRNYLCNDRTSAYPAEMLHEYFPCGALKETTDINTIRAIQDKRRRNVRHYFLLMRINTLKPKTKQVALSRHKVINAKNFQDIYGAPNGLIIYNGKIRQGNNLVVCWNEIDIEAYQMLYEIDYTPLTMWYFTGSERLPDYIKKAVMDDYKIKSRLKFAQRTECIEYRDAKSRVNTYYGTLSTRPTDTYDTFQDGLFKAEKSKTFSEIKRTSWLNPYIAFYTTSYQRRCMITFISKHPDKVAQFDTDSLYTPEDEELLKDIAKFNKEIEHKNRLIFKDEPDIDLFLTLGQWEVEERYKKLLCMGAKKYIKETQEDKIKTVIAGLPKKALNEKINAESIKHPLQYFNVVKKFLEEGVNNIIIEYMYAKKLASEYNDSPYEHKTTIRDYNGKIYNQTCGCYHALLPIDFTLQVKPEFLEEIKKVY